MGEACPNPEFPYDSVRECWEACIRCGQLAWNHEQANPLTDIHNAYARARSGEPVSAYPPAMKD